MVLNPYIFSDKKNFKEYIKNISGEVCFNDSIKIFQFNENSYLALPNWISSKDNFSFSENLSCLIQIILSINYLYYKITKKLIEFPYQEKIFNIYKENEIRIKYLEIILNNNMLEKLLSESNIKNLIEEAKSPKNIMNIINYNCIKRNYISTYFEKYKEYFKYEDFFYINHYKNVQKKLKEYIKDFPDDLKLKKLLFILTFPTLEDIVTMRYLSFSYIRNHFISFFSNISKQMEKYEKIISEQNKERDKYYEIYSKLLENLFKSFPEYIKKTENREIEVEFFMYGSYKNGVHIPTSDRDYLVKIKEKGKVILEYKKLFKYIKEELKNYDECNECTLTNKCILINKLIKIKFTYLQICFDISSAENEEQYRYTYENIETINKILDEKLQIKPFLLVLKSFFQNNNLNKVYFGGINSFELFCILYIILLNEKNTKDMLPGELLFLFFYKIADYDYENYIITKDNFYGLKKENFYLLEKKDFYLLEKENNCFWIKNPLDETKLITFGLDMGYEENKSDIIKNKCLETIFLLIDEYNIFFDIQNYKYYPKFDYKKKYFPEYEFKSILKLLNLYKYSQFNC